MTGYFHVSYVFSENNTLKFGDCLIKTVDTDLSKIRQKLLESIDGEWKETPCILSIDVLDKKTYKMLEGE